MVDPDELEQGELASRFDAETGRYVERPGQGKRIDNTHIVQFARDLMRRVLPLLNDSRKLHQLWPILKTLLPLLFNRCNHRNRYVFVCECTCPVCVCVYTCRARACVCVCVGVCVF
jgi:hypothetical protein